MMPTDCSVRCTPTIRPWHHLIRIAISDQDDRSFAESVFTVLYPTHCQKHQRIHFEKPEWQLRHFQELHW